MASDVGGEQAFAANRKEEQENGRFKLQVLSASIGGRWGQQQQSRQTSADSLPSAMLSSMLTAKPNVVVDASLLEQPRQLRTTLSGGPRGEQRHAERLATNLESQQRQLHNSSNNHNHRHHIHRQQRNQSQQQQQQKDCPINTNKTTSCITQVSQHNWSRSSQQRGEKHRQVLANVSQDRLQAGAELSAAKNSRIGANLANITNATTKTDAACCCSPACAENKCCSIAYEHAACGDYKNVPRRSHIKWKSGKKQQQQQQQQQQQALQATSTAKRASLPMLFIFCTFILIIILANFTPATEGVDCFKCSSRNGSNPDCEDPFHNLHTIRITSPMMPDPVPDVVYHTPCYAGKKNKHGLFPARACIKLTGTFDKTGETLVVRHCALDHGTLTQDTEIARMSHCGQFQFEGDMLKGCVSACPEDACNSAPSSKLLKMPEASLLTALVLAYAALALNKLLAQHGITRNILHY